MNYVALCAVGAEKILGNEIKHLGWSLNGNAPGRVNFTGEMEALYRSNYCLRTSDRVYLQLAKYRAENFDELKKFEKTVFCGYSEYQTNSKVLAVLSRKMFALLLIK